MSTPFQNRLVGTVMVAAAAVIFLPDFLDGKKQEHQTEFEGIPQAPSIVTAPENHTFPQEQITQLPKQKIDKEQALADVLEKQKYNQVEQEQLTGIASTEINTGKVKINTLNKTDGFTSSPDTTNTAQETLNAEQASLPDVAKQPEQTQWVVQLGSFRHEKNVRVLVDKLTENGFKVFTKPIKTKNGSLTKVFVGPELVKSVLEKNYQNSKS